MIFVNTDDMDFLRTNVGKAFDRAEDCSYLLSGLKDEIETDSSAAQFPEYLRLLESLEDTLSVMNSVKDTLQGLSSVLPEAEQQYRDTDAMLKSSIDRMTDYFASSAKPGGGAEG